ITNEVKVLEKKGINLLSFMKKKLGNGLSTFFWEDGWCEWGKLKERFPRAYALENLKHITVGHKLSQPCLSHSFRRNPRGGLEESQVEELSSLVQSVELNHSQDKWSWSLHTSAGIETTNHLFFACDMAKKISQLIARWWDVLFMDFDSYGEWRSWIDNEVFKLAIAGLPPPAVVPSAEGLFVFWYNSRFVICDVKVVTCKCGVWIWIVYEVSLLHLADITEESVTFQGFKEICDWQGRRWLNRQGRRSRRSRKLEMLSGRNLCVGMKLAVTGNLDSGRSQPTQVLYPGAIRRPEKFNTTTTTYLGPKLVVAAGGATNTCIDNERQALLAFKARLLDPDDLLSTWRPEDEDDCCKWSEVTCDNQTGHVTKIELCYYDTGGIGGEISLSLLNLSYLNHLDLSFCPFHGTIPPFIGSMTRLTYLDLSDNEFIGTIPMFIGNMTQLKFLALSYNQFTGTFPMSIGSLTGLTILSLEGNQFVGTIPMSIGYLKILTDLSLSGNNFSGIIPRSISSLTKLKTLFLSENSFHGTIPPEFGNLTNLESLLLNHLKSCTIENLDWLSSLSSLSELNMDGTSLAKADNWVNVIIGLENLEWLKLSRCDLSKVMHPYSSVVNSSSSIDTLYLDNNDLNSTCYRWLCPLVGNRLKEFFIYGNSFDGKLRDFLNNLSRCISPNMLKSLDASNNK
nr:hypothetical protein [Tanacetum cinerariifolium]